MTSGSSLSNFAGFSVPDMSTDLLKEVIIILSLAHTLSWALLIKDLGCRVLCLLSLRGTSCRPSSLVLVTPRTLWLKTAFTPPTITLISSARHSTLLNLLSPLLLLHLNLCQNRLSSPTALPRISLPMSRPTSRWRQHHPQSVHFLLEQTSTIQR